MASRPPPAVACLLRRSRACDVVCGESGQVLRKVGVEAPGLGTIAVLLARLGQGLEGLAAAVRDAARLTVAPKTEHGVECERAAQPAGLDDQDVEIESFALARALVRGVVDAPDRLLGIGEDR